MAGRRVVGPKDERHAPRAHHRRENGMWPAGVSNHHVEAFLPQKFIQPTPGSPHGPRPARPNGAKPMHAGAASTELFGQTTGKAEGEFRPQKRTKRCLPGQGRQQPFNTAVEISRVEMKYAHGPSHYCCIVPIISVWNSALMWLHVFNVTPRQDGTLK